MLKVSTGVTLDANWRWIHGKDGYQNCYTGNEWDQSYCPDAQTCTDNCLLGRTLRKLKFLRRLFILTLRGSE